MQKIRKAVFLAAGFGTRFLPATKSQPKEMLPIVDKPVIQYLVEEAVSSGIKDIVIVTSSYKRSIKDHFNSNYELEKTLEEKGKTELLKLVREVTKMANFTFVDQPKPLGDGHAILCAKDLIGNEPFAVMFGDDLVDNEKPALKQLIEAHEQTNSSIVALEKIDPKDTDKYGIIEPNTTESSTESNDKFLHLVKSFVEKPAPEDAPSDLGIIGKYVVTAEIIKSLENATPSKDGEIRLIDGFIELSKTQKIYGYEIQGERFDAGNKLGLIQANIHYALKRDDLGPELKKYLKSLVLD